MNLLFKTIYIFNSLIFFYVVFVDLFYFTFFLLSLVQLRKYMKKISFNEYEELRNSKLAPPVSILVPAFNEEVNIKDSIKSFLNLDYPNYEVIVINDGSIDNTLNILIEHFDLIKTNQAIRQQIKTQYIKDIYRSIKFPYLVVINKANGGKADALNAGINFSSYPYYCGVDADSVLEHDALLRTMSPFFEGESDIIACGGIVRIANGCKVKNGRVIKVGLPKNIYAINQVIEYLRSFLVGRLGLSSINNLLIISGAFGVFRKKEVLEIDGYNPETVGEDMELVIRLQKYLYDNKKKSKVLFIPDPVCWTEAPENYSVLYQQRKRWNRGLIQSLFTHRKLIFNPKYGLMGLLAMPYFLLVELLGPPIELIGLIFFGIGLYFHIVNILFAITFLIATLLFGIFMSWGSVLLEEWNLKKYPDVRDLLKLSLYSIIDNFWYRQLNAYWKIKTLFLYSRKDKSWGRMVRKGFTIDE